LKLPLIGASEDELFELRDKYFRIKRDIALEKHREERSFFQEIVFNREK
jgi:hypothetical protein